MEHHDTRRRSRIQRRPSYATGSKGHAKLDPHLGERIFPKQAGSVDIRGPVVAGQAGPVDTHAVDQAGVVENVGVRVEGVRNVAGLLEPIVSELSVFRLLVFEPCRRPG